MPEYLTDCDPGDENRIEVAVEHGLNVHWRWRVSRAEAKRMEAARRLWAVDFDAGEDEPGYGSGV